MYYNLVDIYIILSNIIENSLSRSDVCLTRITQIARIYTSLRSYVATGTSKASALRVIRVIRVRENSFASRGIANAKG